MTDAASTANTINAAMQDPVPYIGAAPDTVVSLLKGINGDKTAIVREMTGADEEFLASLEARSTLPYQEYLSSLLKRTVLSIGDIDVHRNPDIIDNLIVGDRDILFLSVVKATYGKIRKFNMTCPYCNTEHDLTVNIEEDFPIEGTEEDADRPIEVTLRNGTTYRFHLPTGGDTKYVAKKGKNVAEQNTMMIGRCLESEDIQNKEQWARNLNIGDRSAIISALLSIKIGPKAGEVNDPCPSCGEQLVMPLDWVSLLFG